ncbi:hypothetical protein DRE_04684 [Drechslerella stenobrocha 248]|uniref:Uncharacterized protein n=1 Tax=Drechslerella stenobrocha 248 TaxID=1043628 RepID=W7IAM4_9PEZI|nr:hypothetical protein DRE_04684 [Drechslerella stenobrocha 248]
MADDADLASMGFTAFGKTPKSHSTLPMHANPTPLPSSLPARPPQQQPHGQQSSNSNHRPRDGHRGNFDNQGGPYRPRGFHCGGGNSRGGNNRGRGRGRGRGGFHPYQHQQQHHGGDRGSSHHQTPLAPAYTSPIFGEGLYKPSMNEDPWQRVGPTASNTAATASSSTAVAATPDVWLGSNTPVDKSAWHDKEEDKAADGGGWNADEIDLDDEL